MAQQTVADQLREMALHRGFKLVKSRRRKPGAGDYGKFGLLDAAGKPLLGVGNDGLTATAKDIEAYLRAGATSTWKQSAETTPDRPQSTPKGPPTEDEELSPAKPVAASRRSGRITERTPSRAPASSRRGRGKTATNRDIERRPAAPPSSRSAPAPKPSPEPRSAELVIRAAKPGDAKELAALINQLRSLSIDEESVARNLATVRRGKGGIWVAQDDGPVGICAWTMILTLHRGQVGRISLLLVDKARRREGLGTRLLAAESEEMEKSGCALIEVMSDIDLSNAHGFFRSIGFEQASYRFTLPV